MLSSHLLSYDAVQDDDILKNLRVSGQVIFKQKRKSRIQTCVFSSKEVASGIVVSLTTAWLSEGPAVSLFFF